ncbi:MAG: 2Fe-2S iron-sulfur cluster binding domain-containing protein [Kangiellaceae bacterium]|nr:2Fe-2S iron-sulfur cluster binding domain-containing protein [Kangiellaceae bacterium]
MRIVSQLKRLHKWIAILIGIQLLLWVVSGIVFSFIEHREVGGNFIFKNNKNDQITDAADFSGVLKQYPQSTQITQITLLKENFFKIELREQTLLQETETGRLVTITKELVREIAIKSYGGKGQLKDIVLVNQRSDENRGMKLPVWQVVFEDSYGTHLYLSSTSAEYQGVRTDSWRIFDFFMMLHFMDYGDRGNFNNGLIIFFSLVLVLFSISGMLLVTSSFSQRDFSQLLYRFIDNQHVKLRILNVEGKLQKIKVSKDTRLLEALESNNIELPSVCGGGGICGTCRIRIVKGRALSAAALSDHDLLEEQDLTKGYRLACQLSVHHPMDIEIEKEY